MESRCLKEVAHFFLSDADCSGALQRGAEKRVVSGIIHLDHRGVISSISPTAQKMLNLCREECLGEPFNYFIREGEKIQVGIITENNTLGIGEMYLEKEFQKSGAAFRVTVREISDCRCD